MIRAPDNTQRLAIFGQTGTGKTQAALWWLAGRDYTTMPFIVIDYKRDPGIEKIPGLNEIDFRSKPPKHAGLFVIHPFPEIDNEAVDEFLLKIWENGRTGVFLDEGYMLGRYNKYYRALLTQGRSKRIPIITLSQRPSWISPFILSESEYIQCFFLQTPADQKRIGEFMPGVNLNELKKYHSYYWNLPDRELTHFAPVPNLDAILNRFDARRAKRRWPI